MCLRIVMSQIGQAMQQEHEAGEKEQQMQLQDEAAFAFAFYQPIHHTVPNTSCSQSILPSRSMKVGLACVTVSAPRRAAC